MILFHVYNDVEPRSADNETLADAYFSSMEDCVSIGGISHYFDEVHVLDICCDPIGIHHMITHKYPTHWLSVGGQAPPPRS